MVRLSYLVVLGLLLAARANAATFVVNSANDVDDGACTTVHCSLREAIRAANVNPGTDDILFNISPGGAQTIVPLSALPAIADSANFDGSTQPGYAGNPIISIRGDLAGAGVNGLVLNAPFVSVKHLRILPLRAVEVAHPAAHAAGRARRATVPTSRPASTGFGRWASKPAACACSTSSGRA